jgi:hypothetical protein
MKLEGLNERCGASEARPSWEKTDWLVDHSARGRGVENARALLLGMPAC